MGRSQQQRFLIFKFKGKTITMNEDAGRIFEDKFDKVAEKIYAECDSVVSRYDGLVTRDYSSEKNPTPSPADKIKAFEVAVCKAIPAYAKKSKADNIKREKRYATEAKERAEKHLKEMKAIVKAKALPSFLQVDDLVAPLESDRVPYDKKREFFGASDMASNSTPLYFVEGWGWCLPVLRIKSGSRHGAADRAYAVRLSDGSQVRVGLGPHVTAQVELYLTKSNIGRLTKSLKPMLDKGAVEANQTRDTLSTRRMRRSIF